MKTINAILTLAVIGAVGFVGYKLYQFAQQFGLPGNPLDWSQNAFTGKLTDNQIQDLGQQAAAGVTQAGGSASAAASAAQETSNFATWNQPLCTYSVLGVCISSVPATTDIYGVSVYEMRKGGNDDAFILNLYNQQIADSVAATVSATAP